ncbi:transmembrane transporter [Malassezia pachydermatis]
MQLSKAGTGAQRQGIISMLGHIIKNEGPSNLYRGMAPLLLLEAPKRALKFGANDFWGKTFRSWLNGHSKLHALLTGCAAGATESLIVVPFELVKIRLQDPNQMHLYKGPMDVVRHIYAEHGHRGLYRGLSSTMLRHVFWNGGYFGSIPLVREALPVATTQSERLRNSLLSGTIGGFIGTALNTPLDVVKTRIQNSHAKAGERAKYHGTFSSLATIFREEGASALYKGFVPKVARLAPGGGILLLVVEVINNEVRRLLGPPYI